ITAPLGMLIASMILRFRKEETDLFFQTTIREHQSCRRALSLYLIAFLVVIGFSLLYLSEVKTIPVLYVVRILGVDSTKAALMREQSYKLLDSHFLYIYSIVRELMYPFLIILSLGYALWSKRTSWRYLFLLTAAAGIIYEAITFAKGLVATLFVMMGAFHYFYRGGTISRKLVILL